MNSQRSSRAATSAAASMSMLSSRFIPRATIANRWIGFTRRPGTLFGASCKGVPGAGPPDEFRFTPEEIDEELSRAGYESLSRYDFLPRQTFQIYGAGGPEQAR